MASGLKFVNLLPLKVKIYAYRVDKLDLVGELNGHAATLTASKTISGMVLKLGDTIHITYTPVINNSKTKGPERSQGPEYEICEPITLVIDTSIIRIGDVVYEAKTNTLVQRSHSDIAGIRVHNKVIIPVRIYFNGMRLAQVHGDDGTSLQSGSPSTVYVNNSTKGFNIGDKLDLRFVFAGSNNTTVEVPWCVATIADNYMSDLYLGVINQHHEPIPNDVFSYRAGSPNYSGLKYIRNNTAYSPFY